MATTLELPPPNPSLALDPYLAWNLGVGRRFYFPRGGEPKWIPVLIHLVGGTTAAQLASGMPMFSGDDNALARWRKAIVIARHYTHLPESLAKLEYITAFVTEDFFEIVKENGKLSGALDNVTLSLPLSSSSYLNGIPAFDTLFDLTLPSGPAAAHTVVVGTIDDGLAIANARFRNAAGTRIEYAWFQDGTPIPSGFVAYGREFEKRDNGTVDGIDTLLANATHGGIVDEDEFYYSIGQANYDLAGHKAVAWRLAHGTHVLDTAFGAPASPAAWPIVCVQLPIAITADSSGALLAQPVIDGVWHILLRSLFIAVNLGSGALPVVINISYGFHAGPHDGTHRIELAIDAIVSLWSAIFGVEVAVVIASGNSHLARGHAVLPRPAFVNSSSSVILPWRVLPDDQTPSFLEVWIPGIPSGSSRLTLDIIPPTLATSPGLMLNEASTLPVQWTPNGQTVCLASYQAIPGSNRGLFLIQLMPTASLDPAGPTNASFQAPPGIWTITLRDTGLAATDVVHAWIQRDDTPYGYPVRGRQSYFDDPAYRRLDAVGEDIEVDDPASLIKRASLMNAMATGRRPIVIGGLLRKELRQAKYSAGGPVVPKAGSTIFYRVVPDALAVSDDSIVHAGVLAAGTRSGSVVAMNGTSVAAPRIARWVAEQLTAGLPGTSAAVWALAATCESGYGPLLPPPPPINRGGAGRIRLDPVYPLSRYDGML